MTKTKDEIITEIKDFIRENGGSYSQWYVGISEEPKTRLQRHNVKDAYIIRDAGTTENAREIEIYFIEKLGTDGGSGGGDKDAQYVYAYKKKEYTDP